VLHLEGDVGQQGRHLHAVLTPVGTDALLLSLSKWWLVGAAGSGAGKQKKTLPMAGLERFAAMNYT
jgi:hypothetical protein